MAQVSGASRRRCPSLAPNAHLKAPPTRANGALQLAKKLPNAVYNSLRTHLRVILILAAFVCRSALYRRVRSRFVQSVSVRKNESRSSADLCRKRRGRWQSDQTQAKGRGKRGNSDVPEQTEGSGALHAQKPETVQIGGDPARHRLHLRSAVRSGNPSRRQCVRRSDRSESEKVSGRGQSATTFGRQAESEYHSESLRSDNCTKHNDDRSINAIREAVKLKAFPHNIMSSEREKTLFLLNFLNSTQRDLTDLTRCSSRTAGLFRMSCYTE